jgi:hypothetical protein
MAAYAQPIGVPQETVLIDHNARTQLNVEGFAPSQGQASNGWLNEAVVLPDPQMIYQNQLPKAQQIS